MLAPPKDYTEYWEAQVLTVKILQNSGLKVGVKDRLPIFRLWLVVNSRMTGARKDTLVKLLDTMLRLRMKGREPTHNGKVYN